MKKSVAIDDYQRNLDLSIQWCRWILKPMGVWPSTNISRTRRWLYRLIHLVCFSLVSFLLLPCSLYMILEVESTYNKIRLFGPLIFCVMALMKYYLLIVHNNDIRECIKRIEVDWKNVTYHEDKKSMMVNAKFGGTLITVCALFVYSGYAFYYIAIPINMGKVGAENKNVTFAPLAFPFSRLIVDTGRSPMNEIIFSIQLIAGALIHSITSAACGLAAMLAVHVCGQVEVLMNWLEHLVDGRTDMSKTVDGRIVSIVQQHVRTLRFLTLTENTLQQISFVEFLGCTLDICLAGYYIIMDSKSNDAKGVVTYIILLISLTFNIFIFCYIGEIVSQQCRKVGEMAYMTEWYRLPGNKKLCCILVIAMSNSSIKLTAGNMVELSINTFASVVQTAVAYLNVLRTLT